MGIEKPIILDNGVVVKYFRIATLTTVVNQQSIIELAGYTSQEKREEEASAIAEAAEGGDYPSTDVFIETMLISVDYDPDMSVSKAYEYVKSLPEFQDAEDVIESWSVGASYYTGDLVMDGEQEYECIQPHTSQEGWEPHATPALWKAHEEGGDGVPVWVQPTGAQDAYNTGDKVHYPTIEDPVYESTMDANVYSPEAYPQGWRLVEGGE